MFSFMSYSYIVLYVFKYSMYDVQETFCWIIKLYFTTTGDWMSVILFYVLGISWILSEEIPRL